MTLEEHARAIEAAIQSAARDGYYLDDGEGLAVTGLELNDVDDADRITSWEEIRLPESPLI
ncbi:hypothetical protein [Streptomyces sp. SID5910]|uniref:hypothetical protein n=1 Tax=Streptomyces sp. SID5910 TaxID=2690312 RepID=UPI00136E644E|nr:hypothetical protein [Streptomyces sp. SID5910]MYR43085.1 hypothetical protein [Streptomyces sp. SID5910]